MPRLLVLVAAFRCADAVGLHSHAVTNTNGEKRPHVVMIVSDDIRPELSPYGHDYMHTPAFAGLASDGFFFRRAYAQYALCNPSRSSALTGRRPDVTQIYSNEFNPDFRQTEGAASWKTIPQHFKENGYHTIAFGKIFHSLTITDLEWGSWSEKPWNHGHDERPHAMGTFPYSWKEQYDGNLTVNVIKRLEEFAGRSTPFFIAVGFSTTHFPWYYPEESKFTGKVPWKKAAFPRDGGVPHGLDLGEPWWFDNNVVETDFVAPSGDEKYWWSHWTEACDAVPEGTQIELKRAYLSTIQYIDVLVGKITDTLKKLGLYDNTLVVFWSDHGLQIGDHCLFFKNNLYEDSARVPLFVKPPGASSRPNSWRYKGAVDQVVELVDLFPTMVDLAGLAQPEGLQGKSWLKLLQPGGEALSLKSVAYTQNLQTWGMYMGYTIRTQDWRYAEWLEFGCPKEAFGKCDPSLLEPRTNSSLGFNLYSHRGDNLTSFGDFENENLGNSSEYQAIVNDLRSMMFGHFAHTF